MSEDGPKNPVVQTDARRRRLLRVATAYALVSWVLLQLGEITFDPLGLPEGSLRALIVVVVLGFPVALVLAWLLERGPRGLRPVPGGSLGSTSLLVLAVLAVDALAGYSLYSYYATREAPPDKQAAAPAAATAPAEITAPPNSIAVLPFVDLSPEGDQQYFSDGISEEILNVLAKMDGLKVAARTSSFALRGGERDVREIGTLLSVATVLEGSIRKAGDSVRVTAQLIDTANGFHLWSNNYDRRLEDIFAIQDEIAREIVTELLGSYTGFASTRTNPAPIASFQAYDLYLQGRELWQRRTPESLEEAVSVFQRTLELDPAYAPAYSGLADAYLLLANYGNLTVAESIQRATPLIQTALELDGQMSEGFASLGLMYWKLGRFAAAETHLKRATRLDPDNLTARMWLGTLVGSQGRLGEERLILGEALAADPLNPLITINVASNDLRRGELDSGMQRLNQIREVYPASSLVLRTLAEWSAIYGDLSGAIELAERALAVAPDEPANQATMAQLLLSAGAMEPARQALEAALAVGEDNTLVMEGHASYLLRSGQYEALKHLALARSETRSDAVATAETLMPSFWLARVALLEGAPTQASRHLEEILDQSRILSPGLSVETLTWSAAAHRLEGADRLAEQRLADAEKILSQLRLEGANEPDLVYLEACVAALQSETGTAMDKLEGFRSRGWVDLWEVQHDARLASLRGENRFEQWLAELQAQQDPLRTSLENQFAQLPAVNGF